MSAFAVHLRTDGSPLPPGALAPLMDALAPLGRDGRADWQDGPIALGYHLTLNTPQSRTDAQPRHDARRGLTLVADARLDNRAELAAALDLPPGVPEALPDSAYILEAYARWGVAAPEHLLGDFAFALWDAPRRRLLCARDFIGARPFYFHHADGRFLAASDLAALLAGAALPAELDLPFVKARLQHPTFAHLERTAYRTVRKLPPAHALVVENGRLRLIRHWQPGAAPEIRYPTDADYVAHLRALLDDAIAARLRTAYPAAAHMSGGIDSTTVAVLAARHVQPRRLTAYSWAPSPEQFPLLPRNDERERLAAIATAENIHLCYTDITAEDIVALATADATRRPLATLQKEAVVGRMAAAAGIRTILSGWGGDEFPAFNGRGYFSALFLKGRWGLLQREIRLRADRFGASLLDGWREVVLWPLLPDVVLRHFTRGRALNDPEPLPDCLATDFAAELQGVAALTRPSGRERPGVRRMQRTLLALGHLTNRLESWAAHGSRLGLEYGYPLLDRRIVEFCLAIPPHLFFKDGWKRYIFRQLADPLLPEDTVWKLRKDDPAMVRHGDTAVQQANAQLLDYLLQRRDAITARGLVDPDCLYEALLSLDMDEPARVSAQRALWLAMVGLTTNN